MGAGGRPRTVPRHPGSRTRQHRRRAAAGALATRPSCLPAHRYPGLLESFDYTQSLYAEIADRGIVFARAVDSIETTLPHAREAALLTVDTRTPMFLLKRVSNDPGGVPIEHRRSLYRGDRMTFTAIQTP
ncbi:hypothetical protein GCM10011588_48770 [Nocardia jinanensis]|uniref:UbiC transcription regulator-associated domain-containing protein n=1 Tax=Nocardia jinanensis TaxID=382504 RepID=A0A917RUJ4_9NOCA|nr:hypothetical protein GCM10011588_48770 [Nocardia jinanensis]